MFELTYRNKKVTELTDIQSQKVHTGGTKFAKKNKHTCTTIRDTRVGYKYNNAITRSYMIGMIDFDLIPTMIHATSYILKKTKNTPV